MIRLCILLSFAVFILSCNPPKSERSQQLQEEIESREIKKIPEGDIIAAASDLGQDLSMQTKRLLGSNLKKAIQESGPAGAIEFCNIQAYPLVDSVEQNRDIIIRRTTLKTRNPDNAPTDLERKILEAYQYNHENNMEISDNVQEVDEQYLLYTKPIMIDNALCLNCHGKVGENVTQDTYQLIKNLYPGDSATGFEKGDLRGMWSIKMARKEIVKQL